MLWLLLGVGIVAALAYRAQAAAVGPVTTIPEPAPAPTPRKETPPAPSGATFPRGPDITVKLTDAAIAVWAGHTSRIMPGHGIPPIYGIAWLGVESGGNPCACGGRYSVGPDGYPREQNLFQFYNPDDLKALGITSADLCSFCVRPAPGQPNPQKLIAPLSDAESAKQVEYGAGLIKLKRADADRHLHTNGVTWSQTSPDYWSAVKCPHAWPAILAFGLPQVKKHLGRPPASWAEFRLTYEQIEPLARYNPALETQSPIFRGLRNCEWVGFHVTEAAP